MNIRRAGWLVALAMIAAAPDGALAWKPKDNKCSICPSCCAPAPRATPPSGGGGSGYGAPVFPAPSRDPQRLAEMQRNEKAAEDAWNRGDSDESERRLQNALAMADEAGDRARIQSGLDRVRAFQVAERERKAHEERDRQRAQAEADFQHKVDDMLSGYKADFDGTGVAPDIGGPVDNRPEHLKGPPAPPRQSPPPQVAATPRPPSPEQESGPMTVPDRPLPANPKYREPPPPMISAVPPTPHVARTIEETLNRARGNPVDAQFVLGTNSLRHYPDGDPPATQEELSYLGGMARSYVGRGGRSSVSPDIDPSQNLRIKLEAARGDPQYGVMQRAAQYRDQWMARRNEWIKRGTEISRDGSLEGAVEVLAEQYRERPNPDILNAIRYMEGSRQHAAVPGR